MVHVRHAALPRAPKPRPPALRHHRRERSGRTSRHRSMRRIGWPMGIAHAAGSSAFGGMTLIAGLLGAAEVRLLDPDEPPRSHVHGRHRARHRGQRPGAETMVGRVHDPAGVRWAGWARGRGGRGHLYTAAGDRGRVLIPALGSWVRFAAPRTPRDAAVRGDRLLSRRHRPPGSGDGDHHRRERAERRPELAAGSSWSTLGYWLAVPRAPMGAYGLMVASIVRRRDPRRGAPRLYAAPGGVGPRGAAGISGRERSSSKNEPSRE